MSESQSALPEGTRLLHIGPPKTGTSALQSSCHACRISMRQQGVRYAGAARQASTAAYAVTRRVHPSTGKPPSMRHWNSLVREVRGARERRVLISSEFFAGASDEQAKGIIRDLDPAKAHVAITLRPLAKILASRWQQNVQEGARIHYDEWLREILENPIGEHGKRFWSRQRHDALVKRWVEAVGSDRVTVIVVDEHDHNSLLTRFEELLGLDTGTLIPQKDSSNRSLTIEEIEAVRSFNEQYFGEHFSKALHYKMMARGAALYMKARPVAPNESRLSTPLWAVAKANALGSEVINAVQSLNVRVLGDLDSLVVPAADASKEPIVGDVARISPEVAARMAMGVLLASGRARGERGAGKGRVGPTWSEPQELLRFGSFELLGTLIRRIWSGSIEKIAGLFERHEPPRR
ncbi:MAG: hypothetical protein ACO232_03600 [Candidatus Limnocylindrus sp.]